MHYGFLQYPICIVGINFNYEHFLYAIVNFLYAILPQEIKYHAIDTMEIFVLDIIEIS